MKKILFFALALSLTSCDALKGLKKSSENQDEQYGLIEESKAAVLTRSTAAQAGEVVLSEVFTAEIAPFKENDVTPAVNGVTVDKIYVEVGDNVKEGQLLATLDPTQYNQQQTSYKNLYADYRRLKSVYDAGGISKQTLDQTKTQLDIQREVVENLKKNIRVVSPISGVVTARNTEAGNLFMAQPILTIMQMEQLKVKVSIPEQYFPSVKMGMDVDVIVEIYPSETFVGKISLISPRIDQGTRTFDVEITLPNKESKLRPGMFAKTQFEMGRKDGVLIPDHAIMRQLGTADNYVYVINSNNVAEYRVVKTGRQVGSMIDIVSGLNVGEEVAVTALTRINDGDRVTVKNN